MEKDLSQADLDYCVAKGIISKADSMFYKHYSAARDKRYEQSYNRLVDNLKYYAGIAVRVAAMHEQTAARNAIMKAAINAMHRSYASKQVEPRMNVRIDQALLADLRKIECCDEPEVLERNAQLVLASYFNRMNKIELRDLAKERIVHEVNHVEKFDNGMIKKAIITYSFEEDEPDDYWVPDPKRPPVIQ